MHSLEVRVPGDKSISHRAFLLAPLATGASVVRGLNAGADVEATARALTALGAAVEWDRTRGVAHLQGPASFRDPADVLDCANSGTTARLLLGMLAGLGRRATLTGDASLRRRPMDRVVDPLRAMGAVIAERGEPGRLPLAVESGATRPGIHASPVPSAQVKSALLLAGVCGGLPVSVSEPRASRDHTERMLRAMGAKVTAERRGDGHQVIFVPGPSGLRPLEITIPGDFSSAVFWLVWMVLTGTARRLTVWDVGLNPTRTGALAVLGRMGARLAVSRLRTEGAEPVGDVSVEAAPLRGTEITPEEAPGLLDEAPALAVAAARAEGLTVLRGARELRVKESDRIAVLVENLRAVGVEAEEMPDGFTIKGTTGPLSGRVRTYGDHRIAMALAVLGAQPGNAIELDDPGCVAISYRGFWEDLRRLSEETWR
ncbi:MAG: 3-phosphoshikimate 1-carboxyvinyltransferase [Gemmatimonadetes bacterium]|nr:3-phosphoshikimate 1-carboxyvinyltransferase [Gemmatimonadota bacterium]